MDKLEFEEMCSKLGVFMTTQELTCVYNSFDKNRDGHVSYDEFINTIRVSWLNDIVKLWISLKNFAKIYRYIFIARHE